MHAVFAQNGNEKDGKIREPTTLKEHINARANYSLLCDSDHKLGIAKTHAEIPFPSL